MDKPVVLVVEAYRLDRYDNSKDKSSGRLVIRL